MANKKPAALPADAAERQRILTELNRNLLVEASAGSGKTTCLVGRMVALLAEGACKIDEIAAVTFTRKAAGELRGRFQIALGHAAAQAEAPQVQARLRQALTDLERGFIGTIHSFCGRLLREFPTQAGVGLPFTEIEDADDLLLRQTAWRSFCRTKYGESSPLLTALRERGLNLYQLEEAFLEFTDYPDIEEWPGSATAPPNPKKLVPELREYLRHMNLLAQRFPRRLPTTDRLMPLYRRLPRRARILDFSKLPELMDLLESFTAFSGTAVAKTKWPEWEGSKGAEVGLAEEERWNAFCGKVEPLLEQWHAYRYGVVIETLQQARVHYDHLRLDRGLLNFQDLLLLAARLLRTQPAVRRTCRGRYRRLLVDEFQDTDPIQAEVLMLLTADNDRETDWQRCRPVAGSLFVVGDPQQSIYRFRRADIVTYDSFKRRLVASGGDVVALTTNFRAVPELVSWVNTLFREVFPAQATAQAPAHRPMIPGKTGNRDAEPLRRVVVPKLSGNSWDRRAEARQIAEFIANELRTDASRRVDDYLILTPRKEHLAVYAAALREVGLPCQVAGGNALRLADVIIDLLRLLEAAYDPDDQIALVALARSRLFGVNEADLYDFHAAGGKFGVNQVPKLPTAHAEVWRHLFELLGRLREALRQLPPLAAVERVLSETSLLAQARLGGDGTEAAAAVAKALALLRPAARRCATLGELIAMLRGFLEAAPREDGLALPADGGASVRLMNLHKAKGLEAATVFLADPRLERPPPAPQLHIDRSTGRGRGYMAIHGRGGEWNAGPLLAAPLGWNDYAETEAEFLAAERQRLLYVAATRAADRLVVSSLEEGKEDYWSLLSGSLEDVPEIDSLVLATPASAPRLSVTPHKLQQRHQELRQRWETAKTPSVQQVGVKAEALAGLPGLVATTALGAEWGTLVHEMLQLHFEQPQLPVRQLVTTALAHHEMATEWLPALEELIVAVGKSELWQRAKVAEECHFEVPVAFCRDRASKHAPELVQGQIDLLFLEEQGWILVDFKSDRQPEERLAALCKKYRPQVDSYARIWEETTGEKVAENHLFFTHCLRDVMWKPAPD